MTDYTDSATVTVDVQVSSTDIREIFDSATVLVDLAPSSTDHHLITSAGNILPFDDYTKWSYGDADPKWTPVNLNLEARWLTVKVGVGVGI